MILRPRRKSTIRMMCVFLLLGSWLLIPANTAQAHSISVHEWMLRKAMSYLKQNEPDLSAKHPLDLYLPWLEFGARYADYTYEGYTYAGEGAICTWNYQPVGIEMHDCDSIHHYGLLEDIESQEGTDIAHPGEFAAPEYATALYDLAVQFWPASSAGPDLYQLKRKHAGTLELGKDKNLGYTYLGGVPFCEWTFGGDCPQWPHFVNTSPTNRLPDRDAATALIYLGWVIHLIEDMSVPHHAQNDATSSHSGYEGAVADWVASGRYDHLPVAPGPTAKYVYSSASVVGNKFPHWEPNFAEWPQYGKYWWDVSVGDRAVMLRSKAQQAMSNVKAQGWKFPTEAQRMEATERLLDEGIKHVSGLLASFLRSVEPATVVRRSGHRIVTGMDVVSHESSLAAALQGPNQLDIFYIGNDGALYTSIAETRGARFYDAVKGAWYFTEVELGDWSRPYRITYPDFVSLNAHLAIGTQLPDQVYVFYVAKDGALYTSHVTGMGAWSQPFRITAPGLIDSGAHLAVGAQPEDLLAVFYVAKDGALYYTTYVKRFDFWSPPFRITDPNSIPIRPGASVVTSARGSNRLDVFFVAKNGALYTVNVETFWSRLYDPTLRTWYKSDVEFGKWSQPYRITAQGFIGPIAHLAVGKQLTDQVDVFYVAADCALYTSYVAGMGAWSQPHRITDSDSVLIRPGTFLATATQSTNQLDVFYVNHLGTLYTSYVVGLGAWSQPLEITQVARKARDVDAHITVPDLRAAYGAVVSPMFAPDQLTLFYVTDQGALWSYSTSLNLR